eukprot:5259386-Prymnesium_polylepis.1
MAARCVRRPRAARCSRASRIETRGYWGGAEGLADRPPPPPAAMRSHPGPPTMARPIARAAVPRARDALASSSPTVRRKARRRRLPRQRAGTQTSARIRRAGSSARPPAAAVQLRARHASSRCGRDATGAH